MITVESSAGEHDVAAAIDALRRRPGRRDELVALLPDDTPLYTGRTSAEVTRLRGWLLAAFADTGLPPAAVPYALEAAESGHAPYEVAAAAIALRGLDPPTPDAVPYLLRALSNMSGVDTPLGFERYDERWPYARPTTATIEVLRTLALFGAQARGALPELERLVAQSDRWSPSVLGELRSACEAIGHARPRSDPGHACCGVPAREAATDPPDGLELELEDQDGRRESFAGFFAGKPAVVAFFYTRCDNPYKCPLTVARLARVQGLLAERALTGRVRLAAITYDPEFDIPVRLKRYGSDLGIAFGDDVRFFRTPFGLGELSRWFGLRVNHGPSTVNRHAIEAYVLDAGGAVTTSFTLLQWQPEAVLAVVERLA